MEFNYSIVDPNAATFLQLQHFLEEYEGLQCVAHDTEPRKALDSILKYNPDVLFINLQECATECFSMVRDLYQYLDTPPVCIGLAQTKDFAYEAL